MRWDADRSRLRFRAGRRPRQSSLVNVMDKIKRQFAGFFKQMNTTSLNQENELLGWLESFRTEFFQSETLFDYVLLENNFLSAIQNQIYQIRYKSISAILAFHQDTGEILWLDNHNSNIDFENFILKENLLSWLPDKATDFAKVFVITKLNYLGEPKLINDVSQILRSKEIIRRIQSRSQEDRDLLQREKQQFAEIGDRLQPPNCIITNETIEVNFYLWTKIIGRVIYLQCNISMKGQIKYRGTVLAAQVGNWYVPR